MYNPLVLAYDCPAYTGVYEYSTYVAGASLQAARSLMLGLSDVAINWSGGWHHAKRWVNYFHVEWCLQIIYCYLPGPEVCYKCI